MREKDMKTFRQSRSCEKLESSFQEVLQASFELKFDEDMDIYGWLI